METNFLGLFLPPVIDLINRRIKDGDLRFWLAVLVCVIVGLGLSVLRMGSFNWSDVGNSIMWVFGLSQVTYKGIYEDSGIQKSIRG